jgi:2-hydroxychromene-2-carboxylate isomerase
MSKTVDYFMAPISPWARLGHDAFREICRRHGASIRLLPIDLGAKVFPVSGGVPLAKRAPQRQAYRLVELARWRDFRGAALKVQPKFFPVPQEEASLAIIGTQQVAGTELALDLAGALMRAIWDEERNIADTAVIAEIMRGLGIDASAVSSQREAAQKTYESNTQEAIERQVFGVPWYVYGDEPFWGQDRLDFLDRALAR